MDKHGFRNSRKLRGQGGFTLVEVVVVIAVVALLAAIMAPLIAKNIDDASVARAENEAHVIAAALGDFYKDTAVWPTMDSGGTLNKMRILVSGNSDEPGYSVKGKGWDSAIKNNSDFLENHLLLNTPKGGTGYAETGRRAWKGPYLTAAPLDPWGRPYLVSIAATNPKAKKIEKGWVLSAGPDGVIETPLKSSRTQSPVGDDIAVSFFVK